MYEPIKVCENKEAKLLWDRTIHTYKTVTHNKPDIVLKNKKAGLTYLIDIAVPNQNNISKASPQDQQVQGAVDGADQPMEN